jgi:nucleoside-diphosphate-sugar epimerase
LTEKASSAVDVLVTGAAGFVGEALIEALVESGATVIGADLRAGRFPTVRMDVTDPLEVAQVMERFAPRRVVHAAAIVDDRIPLAAHQKVNVEGTRNVLEVAAAHAVDRFVQVSSIAALGVDPPMGSDAATPLCFDPARPERDGGHHGAAYFRTKAHSEALVRAERRIEWTVVRPGDVYGPRSEPWVRRPLQMMRQGLPVLLGDGSGRMAPCFIDNLVDGLAAALTHPGAGGGIFTFHDGGDGVSYRTYLERLAEVGSAPRPRSMPRRLALAAAHLAVAAERVTGQPPPLTPGAVRYVTRRSSYRLDEAREVLGWEPRVPFDEAMASMRGKLD